LIQKGLKSDYITQEENLGYLKGKLNIKEQITRNAIHKERFFVAYDEYLSDRVENRLIKTALNYLYKKSVSNANKKRIREYLFVFDGIGVSHTIKQDFARVTLGRQMKDYERVLLWAKTFLLENSYTPHKGNDVAFALLFDMNLLFESYVGHYLKRKGFQVALQDTRYHLAYLKGKGRFRLKPDIVIRNKNIIADTKWKILSPDKAHQGVTQADMYQLYAYGTKYRSKSMYLIYPRDVAIRGSRYDYYLPEHSESIKLNVVFFDLSRDRFCRV
jgi:5-methylcytosine-specific restriction enzyme subunit McrC